MNKNIVFKTNSFPNISETFIVSNIIATIKKGYDVKIIVDNIHPVTNTSQPELLGQYRIMERVFKLTSTKNKKLRYLKAIQKLINPILLYYFIKYCILKQKKSLEYVFILDFYKKYRNAAIFHVHFATAINPLFELKQLGFLKAKIIVTFHGYDAHYLPTGNKLNLLINNFKKSVSVITVNSQFLKNKLINKGFKGDSIEVIPIGIDTNFFKLEGDRKLNVTPFKIISVGRLVAIKGHSYGIRTIYDLKNKGFNVFYTIVGDGIELIKLQQLVFELDLKEEVSFLGAKTQNELREILKDHHLFMMTSTQDKEGRCEAFGIVSLEAQAMGLPVVGFHSGGFPETIIEGKTGITVKDKDIEALAKVILDLLVNNSKYIALSNNARKHIIENFDTDSTASRYSALYE